MKSRVAFAAVVAAITVGACADTNPTSLSQSPRPMFSSNASGHPPLISNSVRYKDTSKKAATGRAGSASLTALALLGSDGKTDLSIDAGAPGNLAKVQLKGLDTDGTEQYTRNFNNLSSASLQLVLTDRGAGQKVQVQANIRDADPKRTGVVTITETVKRRPDLTVRDLNAPATALVNTAVTVTASIMELNGDVGATSNCVLLVDGTQVDQALGIWTDAAGVVSCIFNTTFTSVGEHTISVAVQGAVPAEWSTANNSASRTIQILDPTPANAFHWSGNAYDYEYHWRHYYKYDWYRTDIAEERHYERNEAWDMRIQHSYLNGWAPTSIEFPLNVEASMESNGQSYHTFTAQNLPPSWSYDNGNWRQACVQRYQQRWLYDQNGNAFGGWTVQLFELCSSTESSSGYQQTWLNFYSLGGEVAYVSRGYDIYIRNGTPQDYSYWLNRHGAGVIAPLMQWGSSVSHRIKVVDANGKVANLAANIPMQPWNESYSRPLQCYDSSWWYYRQTWCEQYSYSLSGQRGHAWGRPD